MSINSEVKSDGDFTEESPETPGPQANWVTISRFEVRINKQEKVTAPIYANARQQAPIEISIQARDANGILVKLSQAQLKAIRLIEYDTGSAVGNVLDEKDPRYVYQWPVTREDGVEAPWVDSENVESVADDMGEVQTIMKYVHKGQLTTNWIAAEIFSPAGVRYRTNVPDAQPGSGDFDSWVKLHGREPLRYGAAEMNMDRVNEFDSPLDLDLYYVRFADSDLQVVACDRDTDYRFVSKRNGLRSYFQYVFYVGPQRRFSHTDMVAASFNVNQRSGQATLARLSIPMFGAPNNTATLSMTYRTQHGNPADVRFRYADDGNVIELIA